MLSIIAVIGKNHELGKDNKLLWHIPGDLARFKRITDGHPVIMGRKTFQSIGKPLSNRSNIVISSDPAFHAAGIIIVDSLQHAIKSAKKFPGHEEIFVIGGGSVYKQAIESVDKLYLTIVNATAEADTFFPNYDSFKKIIADELQVRDDYSFRYVTIER